MAVLISLRQVCHANLQASSENEKGLKTVDGYGPILSESSKNSTQPGLFAKIQPDCSHSTEGSDLPRSSKGFNKQGMAFGGKLYRLLPLAGGHRRERVWIVAYTSRKGLEGLPWDGDTLDGQKRETQGKAGSASQKIILPVRDTSEWWKDQSPVPIVVDGVSDPAFWREAITATGNAIVPQVAYEILRAISEH